MERQCLSINQREELLKSFEGKTIMEVVCSLPAWPFLAEKELESPEIELYLLKYNIDKYRVKLYQQGKPEWYQGPPQIDKVEIEDENLSPIIVTQGEEIDPKVFFDIDLKPREALALTSKIRLTHKGEDFQREYHIPLMDFDYESEIMDEFGSLCLIREKLYEMAKMSGVILKSSGKKGHYHFLGNRLLSQKQFLVFLGVCLLMRDAQGEPLADSRFIGHSLTRGLKFMKKVMSYEEYWSPHSIYCSLDYDYWPYPDVYTDLRIRPGREHFGESEVVASLGW